MVFTKARPWAAGPYINGCARLHTSATTLFIYSVLMNYWSTDHISSRLSFLSLYSNTRLHCWWIHRRLRAYFSSLSQRVHTCSTNSRPTMSVESVQLYAPTTSTVLGPDLLGPIERVPSATLGAVSKAKCIALLSSARTECNIWCRVQSKVSARA